MRRHTIRRPLIALCAAGVALSLTACGDAGEAGIERLIESEGGGDVDVDLNGDGGISLQSDEGGMSIDEDGNLVVTDADGSVVTGNVDTETGDFSIESEDGSFSGGATTELPDEWPSEIPEPDGLAITSATVIGSNDEQAINVAGTVDGDGFVESYGSALQSAGFNEDSTFTADGSSSNMYSNDNWIVGVVDSGDQSENQINISVYSKT